MKRVNAFGEEKKQKTTNKKGSNRIGIKQAGCGRSKRMGLSGRLETNCTRQAVDDGKT